jgi:hypothetical protein
MVYGLLRAHPGDRALLPPSPARLSASLTPASRCQVHTTWPSTLATPVSRAKASTASGPDVRDVRETPLVGQDARDIDLSRVHRQEEYFLRRGFTDFWVICPSGGFVELIQTNRVCAHGLFEKKVLLRRPMGSEDSACRANHQHCSTSLPATNAKRLRKGALATTIQPSCCCTKAGLLRCARNDGEYR